MKLTDVTNLIFINRDKYKSEMSLKDKDTNFFIINRFLLRRYPQLSIKFNYKSIDKALGLDLLFLKIKPDAYYNNWFWYKKKSTEKKDLTKEDYRLLIEHLELKDNSDIDRLYEIDKKALMKELKKIKDN